MTSDPTLETRVRDIVASISRQDVSSVGAEADLVEVLAVDSLQGLQILAAVEKRFGVRLPDEELIQMRTIRSMVEAVSRQQEGAS
jgi:acyl carrier protein